jgi:hypothetical protein
MIMSMEFKSVDIPGWNIKESFGKANRQVTPDGWLKVKYPKGSSSPGEDGPEGGTQFYAPVYGLPSEVATLEYQVKFDDNFQPVKGGKLPGLYIGHKGLFEGASGGRRRDHNASIRIMWRSDWQAEAYVYPPKKAKQAPDYTKLPGSTIKDDYGDSLFRGILKLQPKAWNKVTITVGMNTPGKADGTLTVSIGKTAASYNKMVWRVAHDPLCSVNGIFFSTFFGGKSDYKTPVTTYATFKDFKLHTKPAPGRALLEQDGTLEEQTDDEDEELLNHREL